MSLTESVTKTSIFLPGQKTNHQINFFPRTKQASDDDYMRKTVLKQNDDNYVYYFISLWSESLYC